MYQKYFVQLSQPERSQLNDLISAGKASARQIRRAYILLKSDCSADGPNWNYEAVCAAYNVSQLTVTNVRKAFVERGLEGALQRKKPDRVYERRLDGEAEAHLVALVCGEPPTGYERWSLRLLKNRYLRLGFVDGISHETIRLTLKKMNLSLG
jgi:hypothetical protein